MSKKLNKTSNNITLNTKPSVVISRKIQNQILFLHSKIKSTEWSGILLYKELSGDITDINNLKLSAQDVFLQDIGSSAYTEYTADESIIDMYDNIPEADTMRTGHIHTHHSMQAFFSGTDASELHDNAIHYDYYLSLIVNFEGTYKAKIAIPVTIPEKAVSIMNTNKFITIPAKTEVLEYDVDILMETTSYFLKQYKKIEQIYTTSKVKTYSKPWGSSNHYNTQNNTENSLNKIDKQLPLYTGVNPITNIPYNTHESQAENFLACLVMLDESYNGDLESALNKTWDFYKKNIEEFDLFPDELSDNIDVMGFNFGFEDLVVYQNILREGSIILDDYIKNFPELVKVLKEVLTQTLIMNEV